MDDWGRKNLSCLITQYIPFFSIIVFDISDWFSSTLWWQNCLPLSLSISLSPFFSLSQGQELVGDGDGGSGFRGGWAGWLDTVACERPESGKSTGSRVRTQRAREGLGGGGRGDRGGEATLGTKADSTDTSHPLGVWLSLAPWGPCSLVKLPATAASASCSLREEAAETLSTQSGSDLWPTFNWYEGCFLSPTSPDQIAIHCGTFSQYKRTWLQHTGWKATVYTLKYWLCNVLILI